MRTSIMHTALLTILGIAATGGASLWAVDDAEGTAKAAAAAAPLAACADFGFIPDDTELANAFDNAGFAFRNLGSSKWLVNESDSERGLQFQEAGMEITLPRPVSSMNYRLGTFARDVVITAYDERGAQVHAETIKSDNAWTDRTFSADRGFAKVTFSKGGGEGNLQRVCVAACE